MNDANRSIHLIENAIDRLIEYGDRIHSISNRCHPEQRRQESKLAREQSTPKNSLTTSLSTSGKSSQSIPTTTNRTTKSSSNVTETSVSSEKETVDNFLYTVTKGGRPCTIPGKMFSKRLPDSWVMVRFQLFDEDGTELLNLKTEIRGEGLRNTVVNGKPTDFC